jgi:hypothetical protein
MKVAAVFVLETPKSTAKHITSRRRFPEQFLNKKEGELT